MGIGSLFTSQLAAPLRVWPHLGSGEGLVAAAYAKKGSWVPPWPSWTRGSWSRALPGQGIPPSPLKPQRSPCSAASSAFPSSLDCSGIHPYTPRTHLMAAVVLHPSCCHWMWNAAFATWESSPEPHSSSNSSWSLLGRVQGQRVGLDTSTGWVLLRPEMKLRWEEVGSKH